MPLSLKLEDSFFEKIFTLIAIPFNPFLSVSLDRTFDFSFLSLLHSSNTIFCIIKSSTEDKYKISYNPVFIYPIVSINYGVKEGDPRKNRVFHESRRVPFNWSAALHS